MKDFTPSCMYDGSNNNFAMYRFLMPYHMTDFDLTMYYHCVYQCNKSIISVLTQLYMIGSFKNKYWLALFFLRNQHDVKFELLCKPTLNESSMYNGWNRSCIMDLTIHNQIHSLNQQYKQWHSTHITLYNGFKSILKYRFSYMQLNGSHNT